MNDIKQDVCAIIGDLFFANGNHFSVSPDWGGIIDELENQSISLLFSEYLVDKDLPETANKKWKCKCFDVLDFNLRVLAVLQWIHDLFEENHIPYLVIKGTSAAVLYPRPILRLQGDIDLVIAPDNLDKAITVLRDEDCENIYVPGFKKEREFIFKKDEVNIEIHSRFATLNSAAQDQLLDQWIFNSISNAFIERNMFGTVFPSPIEDLHGLILLTHINQHLEGGLGFRQIIDWMLFVFHYLDDEKWETFQDKVVVLGLEKLAITVTRMCQLYLGLPEYIETSGRSINWCHDADSQLCKDLLDYLFECGNFGYKQGMENSAAMVISHSRGVRAFFENLQKRGEANWALYKQHSWLKPFAWFYQGCRYGKIALGRKNAWSNLRREAAAGKKRGELIDCLGATSLAKKKDQAIKK